jgi:hypothetical protein
MAIAIAVKLTNIQWVDYYRKLAKERTVKNFVIPANKGNIYSADGSLWLLLFLIMKYVLMRSLKSRDIRKKCQVAIRFIRF